MDLVSTYKGLLYKSCFAASVLITLLWISVFLYSAVYYLYIPAVAHVKPVHFQYSPFCSEWADSGEKRSRHCTFPSANVSLIQGGHGLLRHGQSYMVELTLEMPESEVNRQQGMFMVKLDMISQYGHVVCSSARPAILHYKSSMFNTIYTLFFSPGLLAGTLEEKQVLVIPIFEEYIEDSYSPTYFINVEIHARKIEVYSATLRIHAQFTGLRYFMYYWPLFSAAIGIFSNFFFLCVTALCMYLRWADNGVVPVTATTLPMGVSEEKSYFEEEVGVPSAPEAEHVSSTQDFEIAASSSQTSDVDDDWIEEESGIREGELSSSLRIRRQFPVSTAADT